MSQCEKLEITVPVALQHSNEATCISPWFMRRTEYHPVPALYQYLINGEEAFRAVHEAIAKAEKSIDIICWGFQPSMYFIRDGKSPSIGDLLKQKAAEKDMQVRVLGWEAPFNAAGFAGEANLPGKGPQLWDREGQTATEEQYAKDREWFAECSASGWTAKGRVGKGLPVFVSRGFGFADRVEIAWRAANQALDPGISTSTLFSYFAAPTHHQKTVLVDYELPDKAVGFVMGHNMLDAYWDTSAHSSKRRPSGDLKSPVDPKDPNGKPHEPNEGPRGKWPRQDISSKVRGPILEHLHHNFATAWEKETGEDLIEARQAMQVAEQLPFDRCEEGSDLVMAQLLRTQAQENKRDIERLYLRAINNATQYIYIENQYFRCPPLADAILQTAARQTADGRDPGKHGALHLFVVTNANEEGIGPGTVNTQRMLDALGRADTIPKVTKLMRGEPVVDERAKPRKADSDAQTPLEPTITDDDPLPGEDAAKPYGFEERPGLKIHVCSLVAPDSPPGKPWMPVYIHSKLMIVNDVFTTHGSANINTRSMQVDSELNIAHERYDVSKRMRRELWDLHTDKKGAQDDPAKAFKSWEDIIGKNNRRQKNKRKMVGPISSLIEFRYDEPTLSNKD
ncbi:phospholipase D-like domain-containing protein [Pseudomonas sp. PDM22]|uniref:phospholipase D-like domain-containing protein n=1 Tax=Pseudomonas sp. PDM22 TaxID=2769287 RepID=UPI0009D99478|nr:phospholipase D-like domain-containing protein [Pseudomonas sp. PDM22]MBD9518218.1 phospholipase [Pseudomonas sp. PDM22]OQR33054.1 phospholipase [Pseudomonas sp. T]